MSPKHCSRLYDVGGLVGESFANGPEWTTTEGVVRAVPNQSLLSISPWVISTSSCVASREWADVVLDAEEEDEELLVEEGEALEVASADADEGAEPSSFTAVKSISI